MPFAYVCLFLTAIEILRPRISSKRETPLATSLTAIFAELKIKSHGAAEKDGRQSVSCKILPPR